MHCGDGFNRYIGLFYYLQSGTHIRVRTEKVLQTHTKACPAFMTRHTHNFAFLYMHQQTQTMLGEHTTHDFMTIIIRLVNCIGLFDFAAHIAFTAVHCWFGGLRVCTATGMQTKHDYHTNRHTLRHGGTKAHSTPKPNRTERYVDGIFCQRENVRDDRNS